MLRHAAAAATAGVASASAEQKLSGVFFAMIGCHDAATWQWVGRELLTTRQPHTKDTLLHLAARINDTTAVTALLHIGMNPLLRNANGEVAADLATDTALQEALRRGAAQPPPACKAPWYGPYGAQRVRAFLLVLERRKRQRLSVPPKDVIRMIIGRVVAAEYL